jgi:hypothetical protein
MAGKAEAISFSAGCENNAGQTGVPRRGRIAVVSEPLIASAVSVACVCPVDISALSTLWLRKHAFTDLFCQFRQPLISLFGIDIEGQVRIENWGQNQELCQNN